MLQTVGRNESVEVGYDQNIFYTHPQNVAALAVCFKEIITCGSGMKLVDRSNLSRGCPINPLTKNYAVN